MSSNVTDARGHVVAQVDPYELHLLRRHDVIPPDELRALAAEIGPGFKRWQRWVYWTSCVLGAAGISTVLIRRLAFGVSVDWVGKALWALNLLLWIIAFVGYWLGARRARAGRIRQVMLTHRRCPHCGYDLRGLATTPTDATVCPECGCHWRLAH